MELNGEELIGGTLGIRKKKRKNMTSVKYHYLKSTRNLKLH